MAKKKKTVLKDSGKDLTLLNLKISSKDRRRLVAMAKKYAGGNLSAWLRFAGAHYVPPKSVIIR